RDRNVTGVQTCALPIFSLELRELVLQIGKRTLEIRIFEADRCGATLHLARLEQRRQRLGNVVEDALAPFVLALDLLPAVPLRASARWLFGFSEDVGMAPDELRMDALRNAFQVS